MNRQSARDKFSSRLDGLLSEEEARRFDEYLASDDECRAEYESFRRMVGAVGDLPSVPVPDDLLGDLKAAFRDELNASTAEAAPAPSLFQRLGAFRIAAALAAVALTVFLLSERVPNQVESRASDVHEVGAVESAAPRPRNQSTPAGDAREKKVGALSGRVGRLEVEHSLDDDVAGERGSARREQEGYRWKTFERHYDRLIDGESDETAAASGVDGEMADAAARLVELAKELSNRDGLSSALDDVAKLGDASAPENDFERRFEGGLEGGFEGGVPGKGAPSKGEGKGARGTPSAAPPAATPEKRARVAKGAPGKGAQTKGKAAPTSEEGLTAKARRSALPAPSPATRCYFLFGPQARGRLEKKVREVGGRVAQRSIDDLGDRRKKSASVGALLSVTLPGSAADDFLQGLEKERGLVLRLFSRRVQAGSPAEVKDAAAGEGASEVTLHFIVPR